VREESHLDDMRAAIRGDFERLEQRLGTQELMHVREPEPEPDPEPEPEPEPEQSPVLAAEPVELVQGTQVEPVESEEAVDPFEPAEPEAPAPQSWLARLLAAIPPRQV
jgi:hypothetical protein